MKGFALVLIPFLAGCLSFNETWIEFTKLARQEGVRFYVTSVEMSEDLKMLPIGGEASSGRCEKIRRNLARNCGSLFAESSDGAIPIAIAISAHRNLAQSQTLQLPTDNRGRVNESMFDKDGVMRQNALFVNVTMARLTYEIKCSIQYGDSRQIVTKPVNSFAQKVESPLYPGVAMFVGMLISENFRFNGFEIFYGMADDYDWLAEKEFADVMASAVAEFDVDRIREMDGHGL